MSDYSLPPRAVLICGSPGTGKTTFALSLLGNEPASLRGAFDDYGQASHRLHVTLCYTAPDLEASIPTRWSFFNPHRMNFQPTPARTSLQVAFDFWCQWFYQVSTTGPGPKLMLVDEVWRFQTPHGMPHWFAMCCQAGRAENIMPVTCTQLPHKLHASITESATEIVCFRLQSHLALDRVREWGFDPDKVASLPLGTFIARNRLSGAELTSRVF